MFRKYRSVLSVIAVLTVSMLSSCGKKENGTDQNNTRSTVLITTQTEVVASTTTESDITTSDTVSSDTGTTTEQTTTEEITSENTEEAKPPFSDSIDVFTEDGSASAQFFALDTLISIKVYGENSETVVKDTADLIDHMDGILSTERTDSELYRLNTTGKAACSDDLLNTITKAKQISTDTNGTFDVTVYPLVKLWGFTDLSEDAEHSMPSEEDIKSALVLLGSEDINIKELPAGEWPNAYTDGYVSAGDTSTQLFGIEYAKDGMAVDLSAIGKGYIGDKISELLLSRKDEGLTGAVISLGGSICLVGSKPDGSKWGVGIRDPRGSADQTIAVLSFEAQYGDDLSPISISTAGTYERYVEIDNYFYHHILDPKTGYPTETDLLSATVLTEDGALADALSTALVVMGRDKAIEFWRNGPYDFEMVLIGDDYSLYVTEGLKDIYSSSEQTEFISR